MYDQLLKDPLTPVPNPTQSYWQSPVHEILNGIQSTRLPTEKDVVIIGSGVTGCSVSHHLLMNGYNGSVMVLEAREVCSGATGRNGGRINCVAVLDYEKYRRKFNDEIAKAIVRFELAHYDEILGVAKSLDAENFDKAEVRPVATVAAVFDDQKLQNMRSMLADFEAAFPDLAGRWTVVEAEVREKYHIQAAKGALVGRAGVAWPYRLITGLFAKILKDFPQQFTIESNTPVLGISRDHSGSHPYIIKTPRGEVRAKHIIHCTEGHTSHLLPTLRGILVPRRGQMTVQNPGTSFKDTDGQRSWSFYWESGFDYLSQNSKSGEIFIGGGEMGGLNAALDVHGIASDAEDYVLAKEHLVTVLPKVFGESGWGDQRSGKNQTQASWTGIMCNSLDGVPMVGMLPQEALGERQAGTRHEGAEWISAGYGGYGMVNAWRCGKAVACQFLGEDTPWLPDVYQITPGRVARVSQLLAEIAGSERHLKAIM